MAANRSTWTNFSTLLIGPGASSTDTPGSSLFPFVSCCYYLLEATMPAPLTVVIFGASGDLTSRKLVPALFNLARRGKLPLETQIVGVARSDFNDASFREMIGPKVKAIMVAAKEEWDDREWSEFAKRLHYVSA